uniref:Uncharacterized protein n=1 Tax=Manihot esculenta TaxID=3983 RepID=A0A2C9WC42_MANES
MLPFPFQELVAFSLEQVSLWIFKYGVSENLRSVADAHFLVSVIICLKLSFLFIKHKGRQVIIINAYFNYDEIKISQCAEMPKWGHKINNKKKKKRKEKKKKRGRRNVIASMGWHLAIS